MSGERVREPKRAAANSGVGQWMARSWLAVTVLAAAACSPDSDFTDAPSILPEWTLGSEPLVSIGEVAGTPEYVFDRIVSVRLLPDNRLAVADGSSNTIRVYGADGHFELGLGREGEGPGEFRYLSSLWFREPDTLAVYDSGNLRLTSFLTSGELLPTIVTFRADDGYPEVYLGRLDNGEHAVAWIRRQPRDRSSVTPDLMQVARFEPDGHLGALLVTDAGMRRLGSPLPFSPHFIGAVLGDSIYHTDGLRGEVRVTSESGVPVRTIRVALETPGLDVAWRKLEESLDTGATRRLEDIRHRPGIDSIPAFSEILVEEGRRLWLKQYDPGVDSHWLGRRRTGGVWLVIESDGTPTARVPVPDGFRPLDVRGNRVAGVTRDELGVERVEVRVITRW